MAREIRLPHEKISNSQTITQVTKDAFENEGLNIHVNEVEKLQDDFGKGERILQVKNTKYFSVPRLPWKE